MRITPGFFGAAVLVPSAVEPKSASARSRRVASAGTISALLLASTKSAAPRRARGRGA